MTENSFLRYSMMALGVCACVDEHRNKKVCGSDDEKHGIKFDCCCIISKFLNIWINAIYDG